MPTLDQVTEFLCDNLEKTTISKQGTHFHSRCPFCGDSRKSKSKKRFHLTFHSEDNIEFNCFNCPESGNFYKLYAYVTGITEKEAWKKFNKFDKNQIEERIRSKSKTNQKTQKEQKNPLPNFINILDNCIPSDKEPKGGSISKKYYEILQDFINKRKITQTVYYCFDGRYSHRILIPVWVGDDKLVYFQARRTDEKQEPKYLNPSVEKSSIILNINKFSRDKHICITEGLLDAYSIGDQGTTVLGKELNSYLIDTVRKCTDEGIIIVYDNDKDGTEKLLNTVEDFTNEFLYFLVPKKHKKYKDINEIHVNENINMYGYVLQNSYNWRKTKAKLKLEKWRRGE